MQVKTLGLLTCMLAVVLLLPSACASQSTPTPTPEPQIQLVRVVDGDTIIVNIDGREYTVRYLGIDAPALDAPFGEEARRINAELLGQRTIRLESDVSDTDKEGRLLRYVWAGGLMVNAELVQRGYARVNPRPPDIKYEKELFQRQTWANSAKRGIWKIPGSGSVSEWRGVYIGMPADDVLAIHPKSEAIGEPEVLGTDAEGFIVKWTYPGAFLILTRWKKDGVECYRVKEIHLVP
ncbi:MAG: thermonuclease family protein [Chloroflexi bacterium]|nr:thermonuclease family protein [Chloroflexota bacterium]